MSVEKTHAVKVSTAERADLKPLTSLRFVAALMVLFDHMPLTARFSTHYGLGGSAVGFFFMLSGFILTHTYAKDFGRNVSLEGLRRFYLARFARIYPVVFTTTLLAILLVALAGEPLHKHIPVWLTFSGAQRTQAVLSTLLLVQAWYPDLHLMLGINPPSWSLSAETFFYVLFPFIACYVLRLVRICGSVATTVLAAGIWGAFACWIMFFPPSLFVLYFYPPMRLLDFVLGVLLGAAFTGAHAKEARFATSNEVSIVAVVVIALALHPTSPMPLRHAAWMMPAWGALILAFARQAGLVSTWLSSPHLLRLGRASFALYLVHYPITMALAAHASAAIASIVSLIVSLAASMLIFYRVEQPMRRWILSDRTQITPTPIRAN